MLARQFTEVFGRRAGDRLGSLDIGEPVPRGGESLGQDHEVRLLFRRFVDEPGKLAATVHGALAAFRTVMDRCEPDLARRRSRCFGEGYVAPFRTGAGRPAEIKLD